MQNEENPPSSGTRQRQESQPLCFELELAPSWIRTPAFHAQRAIGRPMLWLQQLTPCPRLLITGLTVAGVEYLAPATLPASVISGPAGYVVGIPAMAAGAPLRVALHNRGEKTVSFRLWFGSSAQLTQQWRAELERGWKEPC